MVIDVHAHFFPTDYLTELEKISSSVAKLERAGERDYQLYFKGRRSIRFTPAFYDSDVRIEKMDALGVTTQVLSLAPPMVFWAETADAVRLCRVTNDALAAMARDHPGRFLPVAVVPLQSPSEAIRELHRAVDAGHRMVLMGTNIDGVQFDDPRLNPFLDEVERLALPIFVHPISPAGVECMAHYRLEQTVGYPMDTTLAAARLVLSGVLDRHPGLRFCWSHLGGALPFLADRIEFVTEAAPRVANCSARFGTYLRNFWYDTVVYSERSLEFGLRFAGADRLLFGTDTPFFGDATGYLLNLIRDASCLSDEARESIRHHNAERLLSLTD